MFIPWWLIIIGIIFIARMASSGKDVLRRRINELEEQVEELEEKTKEESIPDYGYGINDDSL
jgi:hypothetical protein